MEIKIIKTPFMISFFCKNLKYLKREIDNAKKQGFLRMGKIQKCKTKNNDYEYRQSMYKPTPFSSL